MIAARLAGFVCVGAVGLYAAGWFAGGAELERLDAVRCGVLRVVDRHGLPLREVRAEPACPTWTSLAEVPALLRELVVAGEDRRFERHGGVDVLAVARAAYTNVRAGRTVSGASTLTMQLARMLHPELRGRSLRAKLGQVWHAFAIERRLDKGKILEAYLNLAYFGGGAYGPADAAERWFGRPLPAASDAELALLAVLPRAPRAYDPRSRLPAAVRRRSVLLSRVVSKEQRAAIEREPLAVRAVAAPREANAGHFVDFVVRELPAAERRAGGTLYTTLDRGLQLRLEQIVREHVANLADRDVEQAGVVVLDAQTSEIRALVGSRDYDEAQLDIVTRRRLLGSLLKPFVYALAIERGDRPETLALDVGDVDSAYQSRDWVGREAGPLSYREALAGSYNLAAVHVLERVGVAQLHARLKLAGVAELSAPPPRYGLSLALGAARVRLLDVVAGYGFLVRGGLVRDARGIDRLVRGAFEWRPRSRGETRVFAPEVSATVADLLSDPAARHRRFGRGLPIAPLDAPPIVAKTGTASGMSDLSAVLASREVLVGAWTGRFDAAATRGMSGMWGAGPLAQRAFEIALEGKVVRVPTRPPTARSAARATELPPELAAWAERARAAAR